MRKWIFELVVRVLYCFGTVRIFNVISAKFRADRNAAGKVIFPFVRARKRRNLQILVYHRINDDRDPFFPAVSTRQFTRQMEYLSTNYVPWPLEEAVENLKYNALPERSIAVTFDDGYRDNYLNAFPILKQFGIPATIFLVSGAIGSDKMIWHDRVFHAFRITKATTLEGIPGMKKEISLKTLEQRRNAQAQILRLLWNLTDEEKTDCIAHLESRLAVPDKKQVQNLMLEWDDVLTMAEGGIGFGSHTISHPILSKLPEQRLREEIEQSKSVIENHIKRAVKSFAYPVGRKQDFTHRTKTILKEAGYRCAVTTIFGVNASGQDPFELRRGTPWEADISAFAAKLAWYNFVANG
jgi:peptidoglycan/xylan/chitin deacetylase (PgdA/CDA1 family)